MFGGMREAQSWCSGRSSPTGALSAAAVQRDDQALARSPGEERPREQQRRQQIQGAFDHDVG
jgi:hypothetical protein